MTDPNPPALEEPTTRPRLTFFSLARELRDKIYTHALVSPTPIKAWSGSLRNIYSPQLDPLNPYSRTITSVHQTTDHASISLSLAHLALPLLLASRSVGTEAAAVFYGENTFTFDRRHNWLMVTRWLEGIGRVNRAWLRTLEIEVPHASYARQGVDGGRQRVDPSMDIFYTPIFPRNERLALPPPPAPLSASGAVVETGLVENIDPEVERTFALLGVDRRGSGEGGEGRGLRVVMLLMDGRVPGYDARRPEYETRDMDLPNLLELLRVECVGGDGGSGLEILWRATLSTSLFHASRTAISSRDWDILDAEEVEGLTEGGEPKTRFDLRRRRLVAPVFAERPFPNPFPG